VIHKNSGTRLSAEKNNVSLTSIKKDYSFIKSWKQKVHAKPFRVIVQSWAKYVPSWHQGSSNHHNSAQMNQTQVRKKPNEKSTPVYDILQNLCRANISIENGSSIAGFYFSLKLHTYIKYQLQRISTANLMQ
jgi:hypothetical protein